MQVSTQEVKVKDIPKLIGEGYPLFRLDITTHAPLNKRAALIPLKENGEEGEPIFLECTTEFGGSTHKAAQKIYSEHAGYELHQAKMNVLKSGESDGE